MQSTTKVPYESVVTKNTPTSQEDPGSSENNENKLPTKEEIEARIKKEEEEFQNQYLQNYHKYQIKFRNIEDKNEIEKQKLHNQLNEKTAVNKVLSEQLKFKEQQRRKLEEELAQYQELITDHQEKLILIKKNNAIYLDDFVRDKPNERLSAEIREQDLHFRAE